MNYQSTMGVTTGGNPVNLGGKVTVRVVTADSTLLATDQIIVIRKPSGSPTAITLPVSAAGKTYTVKDGKGDAATNPITIYPTGSVIDGASSLIVSVGYQSIDLIFDGANWNII